MTCDTKSVAQVSNAPVNCWETVARYDVDRLDGFGRTAKVRTLHAGVSWAEAKRLEAIEQSAIRAEPGYRNVMSRPIIGIRLINEAECSAAIAKARGQ